MYSSIPFYIPTVKTIQREYGRCQRIGNPEERSLKLSSILTDLKRTDKDRYAFEIEELYLHIVYTALFVSDTPLPKGDAIEPNELLSRYQMLKQSPGYQALKKHDARKSKIDKYILDLEEKIKASSETSASLLR